MFNHWLDMLVGSRQPVPAQESSSDAEVSQSAGFRKANASTGAYSLADSERRLAAISNPAKSKARSDEKFQIAFHETLIEELKQDHQSILKLYAQINMAINNDQWEKVPGALGKFRRKLTDHLLCEGVKLYGYLQKGAQENHATYVQFRNFRNEMAHIGRAAFHFIDRFAEPDVFAQAEMRAAFATEFKVIGDVLADRIRREESQLYPLYVEQRPR